MERHWAGNAGRWLRSAKRLLVVAITILLIAVAVTPVSPQAAGAVGVSLQNRRGWDPGIAKLADFVERRRGYDFDHAVTVHVLPRREFLAQTREFTRGGGVRSEDFRAAAGVLRALGLSRPRAEGLRLLAEDGQAKLAGFYDSHREEVFVRGRRLDPSTKAVVVHELTHALQDQVFDLDRLRRKAGEAGSLAATTLVEGDALRIMAEYVEGLSRTERRRVLDDEAAQADAAVGDSVPVILSLAGSAPYVLGPAFVEVLSERHGETSIDTAFRHPPRSDVQALDARLYLDGEQPRAVEPPPLQPDEHRVGKAGTLGALTLFGLLAREIFPEEALRAALRWGGDRYVRFRRDKRDCVRDAIVGRTDGDTAAIAGALDDWASLLPGTFFEPAVTVERRGATVEVTSCDPFMESFDTFVDEAEARLRTAVGLLALHGVILAGALSSGLPMHQSQCMADGIISQREVQDALAQHLADQDFERGFEEFESLLERTRDVCTS